MQSRFVAPAQGPSPKMLMPPPSVPAARSDSRAPARPASAAPSFPPPAPPLTPYAVPSAPWGSLAQEATQTYLPPAPTPPQVNSDRPICLRVGSQGSRQDIYQVPASACLRVDGFFHELAVSVIEGKQAADEANPAPIEADPVDFHWVLQFLTHQKLERSIAFRDLCKLSSLAQQLGYSALQTEVDFLYLAREQKRAAREKPFFSLVYAHYVEQLVSHESGPRVGVKIVKLLRMLGPDDARTFEARYVTFDPAREHWALRGLRYLCFLTATNEPMAPAGLFSRPLWAIKVGHAGLDVEISARATAAFAGGDLRTAEAYQVLAINLLPVDSETTYQAYLNFAHTALRQNHPERANLCLRLIEGNSVSARAHVRWHLLRTLAFASVGNIGQQKLSLRRAELLIQIARLELSDEFLSLLADLEQFGMAVAWEPRHNPASKERRMELPRRQTEPGSVAAAEARHAPWLGPALPGGDRTYTPTHFAWDAQEALGSVSQEAARNTVVIASATLEISGQGTVGQ